MNSVGELLRTRPVISALILVVALAILGFGTAMFEAPEPDVVNTSSSAWPCS